MAGTKKAAAAAPAPEAKAPAVKAEAPAAPAQEAPATSTKTTKVTGPITVKYRDHRGEPTERTFSKEDHGEDFAKLADEFKATNADKLIK